MFYLETINNKKYLKSDLLPNLMHCFTTRSSVLTSKDNSMQETIKNNKSELCTILGTTLNNLICPTQTHSTNIAVCEKGKTQYPDTDALILTNKEQAICLNFADCTPIILYDEKNNIGAIAHAGWRGTAGKIAPKTIEIMSQNFSSKSENITAIIGPAIGICCYQIGEDVYNQLNSTIKINNDCFTNKDGKIYADLKKINYQQLLACGVKKIDLCNYCTSCANELFFSYRKEKGTTNRHSAVIKLQ